MLYEQDVEAILTNTGDSSPTDYLWSHLQLDLATIGKALSHSPDQCTVILHHIITSLRQKKGEDYLIISPHDKEQSPFSTHFTLLHRMKKASLHW